LPTLITSWPLRLISRRHYAITPDDDGFHYALLAAIIFHEPAGHWLRQNIFDVFH
jgi:hypothetical protein